LLNVNFVNHLTGEVIKSSWTIVLRVYLCVCLADRDSICSISTHPSCSLRFCVGLWEWPWLYSCSTIAHWLLVVSQPTRE
jgi:hypothetical protein